MLASQWGVLIAGVAAIALVNWWFLVARDAPQQAAAGSAGAQEALIVVQGGYAPSVITARAGTPLRIVFDRRETSGCSEEVVFKDLGIRRFLEPLQKTVVDLPAMSAGRHEFACGMNMLHGAIEVRDDG